MNSQPLQLEEAVKQFVAKETATPFEKLHLATTLFGDLGLDGDDAIEFFEAFHHQFEVDLSRLDFSKHFGPEAGWMPLVWIRYLLAKGTPEQRAGFVPITIGHLVEAAQLKEWVRI